ncbi:MULTISPECIES: HutD family protein [unclassified Polaromonas]|uniref:HutD/Ves family protein n=1 Tax=unclassified Polaromonas TaxID=2638319 RepID=UPI000F096341|nr:MULTISPECIES: HutD family protein [unclassified Polaromonas]AYQ26985.1 HutD family protein [Polaromonas sp. SP1]QGJ18170.1 HutD family protein [Polaromonas sp. Pch-P]
MTSAHSSGWNVVRLADIPATPWRNGGGVTRELAMWPDAGDWAWRMSVADVDKSGPFSKFEGIERWFAVLEGAGVQLDVAGVPHRVTAADAPLFFDGAAATGCELIDGKTRDFNLMVRRGSEPSRMVRVQGRFSETLHAMKTIAVYAYGSSATVLFDEEVLQLEPATLAWRTVTGSAAVRIAAEQALWMEIPA